MRPFRFLHAADLHLDSPFRGMMTLPPVIRDRVVESTFDAFGQMIDIAIKQEVDFVVLSGDIYDLSDRSLRAQIQFQTGLTQLAANQIQVFVIHGNHDPENGMKADLTWPDKIHFYPAADVAMHPAYDRSGNEVAHVYGISYATAAVTDNLALKYQAINQQMYNIALLHCNLDGDQSHEHYAPCTRQELIVSGMDYWALGHIHSKQVIHEEPHIVYPGNIQGRSVRELGPKGCYVAKVTDQGKTELTFHRTDAVIWFHEVISIEEMKSEQDFADQLDELIEQVRIKAVDRPAVVRVTIEGRGVLHEWLQRESELQELTTLVRQRQTKLAENDPLIPFVWIENIKVRTGAQVDREQLIRQDSFLGDVLRIARGLADDEAEMKSFAASALDSMESHHQAGKYLKAMTQDDQVEWLRTAEELAIHLLLDDRG